jgi:PTH1 family peptidyl-tRNA hydrolase
MNASPTIKLIVGLGNPGSEYEQTRHNAGFWFINQINDLYTINLKFDKKFKSLVGKLTIKNNQEIFVLLPQSYMNLSGSCVQAFCQFHKITPAEILVAHDELDFPPGDIRLKQSGGAGGHNGIKDIINKLGTPNFNRLRIGIGHPRHTNSKQEVHTYVLAKPNVAEMHKIQDAIGIAIKELDTILTGAIQAATKNLHT